MTEASQKQLLDTVKKLLTSGDFSDLTVVCGSDTYKVHKNIVCSRTGFFARAISFGCKEAEHNKIELPEDEPAIIKLLMQYLYEGDYVIELTEEENLALAALPPGSSTPPNDRTFYDGSEYFCRITGAYSYTNHTCPHHCTSCGSNCNNTYFCHSCQETVLPPITKGLPTHLLTHAKMYEIADKYDVKGLKDLAKAKYDETCAGYWKEPAFVSSAYHVFSTTPDNDKGLRDVVAKTIAKHMKDLVKKPEIEALLTEFNGLAFGLLKTKIEAGWK